MFEFKLPDVGEGMHEAEILRWLVRPGEAIRLDQPMLEIQTDKAVVEIPSPVAGSVAVIKYNEGQIARVGEVLITFETAAPQTSAPPPATSPAPNGTAAAGTRSVPSQPAPLPAGKTAVRAAPAVRKRAVELDIDISQVPASSPDGRVLLQDVEAFALALKAAPVAAAGTGADKAPPVTASNGTTPARSNGTAPLTTPTPAEPIPGGEERKPLAGLRRRIAERMELSWRTIPHVAVFDEADGSELMNLRKRLAAGAEKRGVRMTYLPLIVKAVIQTLRQFPAFNASLDEQTREIIYKHFYHIGIATATPDGLLVPVVREADKLTLLALAGEINRLGEGGRARTLKASELSGSTFTISNVGSYGGNAGTAIINPPEAAILAVGRMQEKAVVRQGELVARAMLPLSLSFDHRLIDGAEAGAFMTALKEVLESPSLMLLEAV